MAFYLILTGAIADEVREPLASAVPVYVPIERAGGVFILPASVLEAEAHSDVWSVLAGCPQRVPDDPEFPPPIESDIEAIDGQ